MGATTVIDEERKGEMNKEIAIFFSIPFVSRPVTFSRGNVENVVGRANVVGVGMERCVRRRANVRRKIK